MKFIKLSVLCLALLVAMPASADIASFFNPFAWIRAAQRTYHWKMNPAKMVAAQEELERLQKIEVEAENIAKIYNVLNQPIPVVQYDKERERGLKADKKKFAEKFTARQGKWNLDNNTHFITGIDFFSKNVLQPALEKIAKENYISQPKPRESWYETLKKGAQNLPKKERNKTNKEREAEFKAWQEDYNDPKYPETQERNARYEEYLREIKRRTNFNTRQKKHAELEALYDIATEVNNYENEHTKIINASNDSIINNESENQALKTELEAKELLNEKFKQSQHNWNLNELIYTIAAVTHFKEKIVEPKILEKEEEIIREGDSWYITTKKAVRSLAAEEKIKTSKQREQEFKDWKEKKNKSNDELAKKFQDRNAWFDEWNAKNNPNYRK